MRVIDAELTAEQVKLKLRPAMLAYASGAGWEGSRVTWDQAWAGSLPAQEYDLCVLGDGSVIVVRVNTGTGNVEFMRVLDPTSSASWAGATWIAMWPATTGAVPSVWADPQAGGTVWVAFVNNTNRRVLVMTSTDYGATWVPAVVLNNYAAGSAVSGVAGCMRATGLQQVYVFVAVVTGGVAAWDYFVRSVGGVWSGPTAIAAGWPAAMAVQGMDAIWEGDFLISVAGQTTATGNGARLWWAVFGDGMTYGVGVAASGVLEQTDASGFLYYTPRLLAGEHLRLGFLEVWTGTGAYRRQQLMSIVGDGANYNAGLWVGPEPFDFEPAGNYGAALGEWQSSLSDTIVLLRPGGAVDIGTVAGSDDLSDRLIGYEYREDGDDDLLLVDLENSDGALDDCGTVGSGFPFLRAGMMFSLTHGLRVAGTGYYDSLAWFRIRRLFRQHEGRGRKIIQVECDGYWRVLEEWQAPRLFQWAAGAASLAAIIGVLVARVGLTFGTVGGLGSSFYAAFGPAVMIQPGTSGKAALRRLMALGPDLAYFSWGGCYRRTATRSEAAAYSVGGVDEHPILRGRFQEGGIAGNAFEVYGAAGALGTSMEYDDISAGGVRRRKILEPAYGTSANAAARAAGDKEKAYQTAAVGWFECFPIHGLEMWDVLSVTYPILGISARRYRVCAIREWYDTSRGRYLMRVGVAALE